MNMLKALQELTLWIVLSSSQTLYCPASEARFIQVPTPPGNSSVILRGTVTCESGDVYICNRIEHLYQENQVFLCSEEIEIIGIFGDSFE